VSLFVLLFIFWKLFMLDILTCLWLFVYYHHATRWSQKMLPNVIIVVILVQYQGWGMFLLTLNKEGDCFKGEFLVHIWFFKLKCYCKYRIKLLLILGNICFGAPCSSLYFPLLYTTVHCYAPWLGFVQCQLSSLSSIFNPWLPWPLSEDSAYFREPPSQLWNNQIHVAMMRHTVICDL
jgi:hypothetical protein